MTMREFTLPTGAQGVAELIVGLEHTAPHVGSGKIAVLATPVMVNLMEAAALAVITSYSIHYTKLYEPFGRSRGTKPWTKWPNNCCAWQIPTVAKRYGHIFTRAPWDLCSAMASSVYAMS